MKPMKDKKYDYCSIWDDLPRGWLRAFGTMMCDELEEEFEKYGVQNKLYVEQAKEKYGGLRLYMSTVGEAQHIIDKYERISENICCGCGRPHTPMLNLSWISPYCKNCYERLQSKNKNFYREPYETYTPKDKESWFIPNVLKWHIGSRDNERIREIDISETVKRLEENWNARHPERKDEWST